MTKMVNIILNEDDFYFILEMTHFCVSLVKHVDDMLAVEMFKDDLESLNRINEKGSALLAKFEIAEAMMERTKGVIKH